MTDPQDRMRIAGGRVFELVESILADPGTAGAPTIRAWVKDSPDPTTDLIDIADTAAHLLASLFTATAGDKAAAIRGSQEASLNWLERLSDFNTPNGHGHN